MFLFLGNASTKVRSCDKVSAAKPLLNIHPQDPLLCLRSRHVDLLNTASLEKNYGKTIIYWTTECLLSVFFDVGSSLNMDSLNIGFPVTWNKIIKIVNINNIYNCSARVRDMHLIIILHVYLSWTTNCTFTPYPMRPLRAFSIEVMADFPKVKCLLLMIIN